MRSPASSSAELQHVGATRWTAALVAGVALIGAVGCRAPTVAKRRVAILPVQTMGVPSGEGEAFHTVLQRETAAGQGVTTVPGDRIATALEARGSEVTTHRGACGESERCIADLARDVTADLGMSTTLAGLGDVRLVRLRVVRARDAIVLHDLQQTLSGGAGSLRRGAADLARRLFPREAPRPWYTRWWLWTAVATAVGAGVGVTVWLATDGDQPERDPTLVHVGDL